MSCSSPARRRAAQPRPGRSRTRSPIADRVGGDADRVARGVGRLGVDDAGERLGDAVQAVLVGQGDPGLVGLQVAHHLGRRVARPSASRGGRPGRSPGTRRRGGDRTSARAARRTTSSAASGPSADMNTSAVWARHAIREISGMASPSSPSGRPLPSQCSSSARTASAVAGGKPSIATRRAPRSQRALLRSSASRRMLRRARSSWPARAIPERVRGDVLRRVADELGRVGPVHERELALQVAVVGVRTARTCGRRCSSSRRP